MKTEYAVIIEDTPKGVKATLYKRFLLWARKVDKIGPVGLSRNEMEKVNRKINDDWDNPTRILHCQNKSKTFILEF